ncbi:MAG: hypothetical protein HDT26_10775 [Subdoligranulum sp.]|nr:hypothetical protein [Subdoligranulum sp.]
MKKICLILGLFVSLFWLAGCGIPVDVSSLDAARDSSSALAASSAESGPAPSAGSDAGASAEREPAASAENDPAQSSASGPAASAADNAEIPAFTKDDFLRVYDGYLFYTLAWTGNFPGADFNDQRTVGEEQWIALPEFSSKEALLNYCAPYFTAVFLWENIAPWFDGGERVCLREIDGKLYYRSPDGGGVNTPLDPDALTFAETAPGNVTCVCPDYSPQLQTALDSGKVFTMLYENGLWRIDRIEYYDGAE